MIISKRKNHNINDGRDHNMSVRSKAHEISSQNMHTSWGPLPGVKEKRGDKRKGYNIHVNLKRLEMGNSIFVRDKVNRLVK